MQKLLSKLITSVVLSVGMSLASGPAWAEIIPLPTPTCASPFDAKPVAGKCVADKEKIKALNELTCKEVGAKFQSGACLLPDPPPAPQCGNSIPDLAVQGEVCVINRKVPRSAAGDYVGDFFKVWAESPALAPMLRSESVVSARNAYDEQPRPLVVLKVLSQRPLGENDAMLTVIPAQMKHLSIGYNAVGGPQAIEVRASDLAEVGATRIGWAFGVLALPFKYYSKSKNISSGLSLGPYVGQRRGPPGSAYTFAATAALSAVKGDVRDDAGKIISTPELPAISLAAGVMWDITKSVTAKPFKMGVFAGVDSVSNDNVVKFKNNRKLWLAFQIGFDFTDN